MDIIINGIHYEVSEATRKHITDVLNNVIAERETFKFTSARVTISLEHEEYEVDILLNLKNHDLASKAKERDLYKAIDSAAAKLSSQVHKVTDKIREHRDTPPARDVAGEEA